MPKVSAYGSWKSPITAEIFGFEPSDPIEPVHIENLESYKKQTARPVETVQSAKAA